MTEVLKSSLCSVYVLIVNIFEMVPNTGISETADASIGLTLILPIRIAVTEATASGYFVFFHLFIFICLFSFILHLLSVRSIRRSLGLILLEYFLYVFIMFLL